MGAKVRQVVGTCVSMNVTVEGVSAKEYMKKLASGEIKV